jgi:hypothetical protein
MAHAPDGVVTSGPGGGGRDRAAARYPAGTVLALVDAQRQWHGFGRIRPCLQRNGKNRYASSSNPSEVIALSDVRGLR